ncbi:aminoglycoside 3'-phosphotransferase [Microlunatus aurantiacus]|uniref:Aminoglycoside 3'-phosphotransferase n=1 Tax=Microlunatus aurantiacus TaxID=446786 RepID=A0ABP7EKE7_9ACTN
MTISSFAGDDVPVPAVIRQISAGHPVVPIWVNGDGGVTFRIEVPGLRQFAKWAPTGSPNSLTAERERLRWAADFAAVPHVLDYAETTDGTYLLTAELRGETAITDRWKSRPAQAVRAAGSGLRSLHDSLPVRTCPFDWSAATRLAAIPGRDGDQLPSVPPVDRLVVCQGDACVPNTLIEANGDFVGHVDLGNLGLADRWADLAVATWSTEWNYGPGWELPFLNAYGIAPDPKRTTYYRALWNLEHPV